jgi:hypothetical protein
MYAIVCEPHYNRTGAMVQSTHLVAGTPMCSACFTGKSFNDEPKAVRSGAKRKFNAEQVKEIRARMVAGETNPQLAEAYGVSLQIICQIRTAKSTYRNAGPRILGAPRKVTDAQVESILKRRAAGERGIDLAKEFGVSPQFVSMLFKGHRRVGGS